MFKNSASLKLSGMTQSDKSYCETMMAELCVVCVLLWMF